MRDSMELAKREYRKRSKQRKIIIGLSLMVIIFCMYMLVLPALTLDKAAYCGHEEHKSHSVEAGCYEVKDILTCDMKEHKHDDACYEDVLICENEDPEHVHDAGCYEKQLKCTKKEHEHADSCYKQDKKLICDKNLHTHTLQCYSNPDADVETAQDWEETMKEIRLTGDWNRDILTIADSQKDYAESTENYHAVDEEKFGYTRYGDWYGNCYGDWCAMFCSFVLHYSGVDEQMVPGEANCQAWIEKLQKLDKENKEKDDIDYKLYHKQSSDYEPQSGDLIFFDWDYKNGGQDEISDHVGFVTGLVREDPEDEDSEILKVQTIEGNSYNKVREKEYAIDDIQIMGYCEIPENPDPENSLIRISDVDTVTEKAEIEKKETDRKEAVSPQEEKTVTELSIKKLAKKLGSAPAVPSYLGNTEGLTINTTMTDGEIEDAFTVTAAGVQNDTFTLYSGDGTSWSQAGSAVTLGKNQTSATLTNTQPIDLSTKWKVTKKNKQQGQSDFGPFSIYDLLEAEAPGFDQWLRTLYIEDGYGTQQPTDLSELYAAFDIYTGLPAATISKTPYDNAGNFDVALSLTIDGTEADHDDYTYAWYYKDADGNWAPLNEDGSQITSDGIPDADTHDVFGDGGKTVMCKVYDAATGNHVADTNAILVNKDWKVYDEAINAINQDTVLNLSNCPFVPSKVGNAAKSTGTTQYYDLTIGGELFNNRFYYDNVANDSAVDFYDAESYANYLVKLYKGEASFKGKTGTGMELVREAWKYYLYDLFDPHAHILKNTGSGNEVMSENPDLTGLTYPEDYADQNVGDKCIEWPKDEYSSFHLSDGVLNTGTVNDMLLPLDFNFLEGGVEYKDFVTNTKKTVKADAAGDANTSRTYNVNISADTQAQSTGPVVLLFQIQTAWQLFDLEHANAPLGYQATKVGQSADNHEIASLYEIKHAMLDFVDTMEEQFKGNNLFIGITETQHGRSQTMFYSSDQKKPAGAREGSNAYVTNNVDLIRAGIENWDSFGNCEHVHYDYATLVDACNSLSPTLSGIADSADYTLTDSDIRKAVVVIGGTNENSAKTDGYACPLPWADGFKGNVDSVYGIRTNDADLIPGNAPVVSWLDYSGNVPASGAVPFTNGAGNTYTDKRVASTRQEIYDYLMEIAATEMAQKKIDINATNAKIQDVKVSDTVRDEFKLDPSKTIKAVISKKDGTDAEIYEEYAYNPDSGNWERGTLDNDGNFVAATGDAKGTLTVSTVTDEKGKICEKVEYTFDEVGNGVKASLQFGIKAKTDFIGSNNVESNVGTPDLEYKHEREGKDPESFTKDYEDTPEVNVPVYATAQDGDETTVPKGTTVALGDLGVEKITEDVHDLLDNYDQINGTVTYEWEMPDGSTVPVSGIAVPVSNGQISGDWSADDLPDSEYLNADYVANHTGTKPASLKIIFTPDAVNNLDNFSDDTTAAAVGPGFAAGNIYITTVELGATRNANIRKEWSPEVPDGTDGGTDWTDSTNKLEFVLKAKEGDTVKYIGPKDSNDIYTLVANKDDAVIFYLDNDDALSSNPNIWEDTVENLPSMDDDAIIEYELAEETDVPGFVPTFRSTSVTETTTSTVPALKVTVKASKKIDKKSITIKYKINNGAERNYATPNVTIDKDATYDITIPLSGNVTTSDITSITATPADAVIQEYAVEAVPEKVGSAVVSIKPEKAVSGAGTLTYEYGGQSYSKDLGQLDLKKGQNYQFNIDNLELNGESYKGFNNVKIKVGKQMFDGRVTTNEPVVKEVSETKPILIVTNSDDKRDVVIQKLVEQKVVGQTDETVFNFTATLNDNQSFPEPPETPDAGYESYTVSADGKTASFSISDTQKVKLIVPYGADLTITEENPSGYYPLMKEDKKTGVPGETATFHIVKDQTDLVCRNTTGYELPKSGGIGTAIFTIAGLLLIGFALIMLIRRRKDNSEE